MGPLGLESQMPCGCWELDPGPLQRCHLFSHSNYFFNPNKNLTHSQFLGFSLAPQAQIFSQLHTQQHTAPVRKVPSHLVSSVQNSLPFANSQNPSCFKIYLEVFPFLSLSLPPVLHTLPTLRVGPAIFIVLASKQHLRHHIGQETLTDGPDFLIHVCFTVCCWVQGVRSLGVFHLTEQVQLCAEILGRTSEVLDAGHKSREQKIAQKQYVRSPR